MPLVVILILLNSRFILMVFLSFLFLMCIELLINRTRSFFGNHHNMDTSVDTMKIISRIKDLSCFQSIMTPILIIIECNSSTLVC